MHSLFIYVLRNVPTSLELGFVVFYGMFHVLRIITFHFSGVKGDMGDPGPRGPNGEPGEILIHVIQFVKQITAGLDRHI